MIKTPRILKAVLWLFFGSLVFIFRIKTIKEGFFYSRPFPERKHVLIALISMFLFVLLCNALIWVLVWLIFF